MVKTKAVHYAGELSALAPEYEASLADPARGKQHPETLELMSRVAFCHRNCNHHDEAEALYTECLRTRRIVLGAAHPQTLRTLGLLALAYERNPQKAAQALEMHAQSLQEREAALGPTHPDTITACRNYGRCLYQQSRHRVASEVLGRAFSKTRATRGLFHPDTWMSLIMLLSARVLSKLPMNTRIKGEYKKVRCRNDPVSFS